MSFFMGAEILYNRVESIEQAESAIEGTDSFVSSILI